MSVAVVQFKTLSPVVWGGRYARIPGDETVFHLRHYEGRQWPVIQWSTDEGTATCPAVKCAAADLVAKAVAQAKRAMGCQPSGSFAINEFGQVLVPSSHGSGTRMLAGVLNGNLTFENPFDPESPIDLSNTSRLQPGDPWKLPYIGIPYRLSVRREIYFWQQTSDESLKVMPDQQDPKLIADLYAFRRNSCRFLVNPFGVVLTKQQDSDRDGSWQPFYIGKINLKKWFTKEEA